MHPTRSLRPLFLLLPTVILATGVAAQTAAVDPTARLREVLPADVAERVIATIAEARSRQLPAQALESRALKFAARGIVPAEVERSVTEHAARLERARAAVRAGRPGAVSAAEVEAGAEAMRQGVDGAAVSELARTAPSGRSLAIPLFVIGSLVERGLPSDEALTQVRDRLVARATDAELERMPAGLGTERITPPGLGRAPGLNRPPGSSPPVTLPVLPTRPPTGVPPNGGKPPTPVVPPVIPPA